MHLDLNFFGWLIPSLQFITHLHSISVWGAAICQISAEIRGSESCFLVPDVCSSFTSLLSHGLQRWLKHACKSRNPSFIDWGSAFKTPLKGSTLIHTQFTFWFIHVLLALFLPGWRAGEMERSVLHLFPQPNQPSTQRFSQYNNPFLVIPVKRHPGQMISHNRQALKHVTVRYPWLTRCQADSTKRFRTTEKKCWR